MQNAGIDGGRTCWGPQLDSQTNIAIVDDLVDQRVADWVFDCNIIMDEQPMFAEVINSFVGYFVCAFIMNTPFTAKMG